MTLWLRFAHDGANGFGTLENETINLHQGDMFAGARPTGKTLSLAAVTVLNPCTPSKLIALWNNFRAAAEKNGNPIPAEPLYVIKAPNSYLAPGGVIRTPASYNGRVIYEGEIGVVIGKRARGVSIDDADAHIFGYTCVNDVTALDVVTRYPTFPQWTRSKSFDSFGAFGPVIATGMDVSGLSIQTLLNGRERQNYPVSDMIFDPRALVSMLSHELTLEPGDIISCGTSLGAGPMRPGMSVEIAIDGIGVLKNSFE